MTTASDQQEEIRNARKILRPTPVKYNKVPKWFRDAYCRNVLERRPGREGESQLITRCNRGRWLDHWGTAMHYGKEAFVSEPYGLGLTWLQDIDALAKQIGCKYEISPNSWHYPGHTIRILFYEGDLP